MNYVLIKTGLTSHRNKKNESLIYDMKRQMGEKVLDK